MMTEGYSVRDYKADDYEAVAKIWEETDMGRPERGDDKETIERCLKTGGKLLVLVDDNNKRIAGTSWMTYDGRRLYLHHFGLSPIYQGKGLSKFLLERSLQYVSETGCQVKLEVHSSNTVAINLYEKAGFRYLGDYKVFIIRNTDEIIRK